MPNYPGKLIVFEGLEGAGKTTQSKLLEEKLKNHGFITHLTKEPGGSDCPIAQKIRDILTDQDNIALFPETELFLVLAARAQHVKQIISPHLNRGNIVISNRFFGSTFAYQHFGRGLFNLEEIKKINNIITEGIEPDITFLLDIEPAEGIAREKNLGRIEKENIAFHQRVRQGYLTLGRLKNNWQIISAEDSIENIHQQVWQTITKLIN